MLTEEDVTWILENLPLELVQHIIADYDPLCFFMMNLLLDYDWTKQCKLTFGFPHKSSIYAYYNLCQNKKAVRLACMRYRTVVNNGNKIIYNKLEEDLKADIIACGKYHTIIMTSDRKLFSQGNNLYKQLGIDEHNLGFQQISDVPDDIVQIGCGYDYTAILRSNGVVMICGRDYYSVTNHKFRNMNLPKDIVRIACGHYHMFALRADGTLMACGRNTNGELGHGTHSYQPGFSEVNTPKDIVQIACGDSYTIIMRVDGTLMSCGRNTSGQLGHGDYNERREFTEITGLPKDIIQIVCGTNHSFIVRKDGTLMSCGDNSFGQLGRSYCKESPARFVKVEGFDNVSQVACGEIHTVIMKTDGTIMGCGSNYQNQLGLGKNTHKFEKITV